MPEGQRSGRSSGLEVPVHPAKPWDPLREDRILLLPCLPQRQLRKTPNISFPVWVASKDNDV